MPEPVSLNTVQFLAWVAGGGRTYEEAMEAWRSTCPRLSAWEDALGDGLISLENAGAGPARRCKVVLTPRGRAALNENDQRGCAAPDRNTQGND